MLPHCVPNQRKSMLVVSLRACLRVVILCVKRGGVKIIRLNGFCMRVCLCDYNVSDSPCHESVGRGLGRSVSYYSESAFVIFFPSFLCNHFLTGFIFSALNCLFLCFFFTFPFFVTQMSFQS